MKSLTRMLLVNWHYYDLEWIEFDNVNFLTGKTGSGKSTIVDALQIVLLGDTNGQQFFNKAANERSKRSLKGYLRGEYGEDGENGFLYLRNGPFSSYLVCEIYDSEKNKYLTLGVTFDCNYSPTDDNIFFILKDRIPENAFLINQTPMEIKDLKHYLKSHYEKSQFDFCSTAREYQDKLLGHLGSLNRRYFTLFKKAVSFTPITDIEKFITENICDAKKPPDLSGMQDNLRQYRKLEQEALLMQNRIDDLEKIQILFENLQEEKKKLLLYQFLIARSEEESLNIKYLEAQKNLSDLEKSLQFEIDACNQRDSELERLHTEHALLIEERGQNDLYKKQQDLTSEKELLEARTNELAAGIKTLVNRLNQYGLQWRLSIEEAASFLKGLEQEPLISSLEKEISECKDVMIPFRKTAEILLDIRDSNLGLLTWEGYNSFQADCDAFQTKKILLQNRLESLSVRALEELEDCRLHISELEKDIKPFDPKMIWFRDELVRHLSEKYGRVVQVDILADLLEIKTHRWVNVIEGYLNRQKQYLLVEPEAYEEAMCHYGRLRREKHLYDVSLIDGEKVRKKVSQTVRGSLAEEVETDNQYARAYIDFLLGNVMKCDKVVDLRKFDKAVTDQGVIYQSFVTGSIHPRLWEVHLIGKKSIEMQLRKQKALEPELEKKMDLLAGFVKKSKALRPVDAMNQNEVTDHFEWIEKAEGIPALRAKIKSLLNELGKLDLSWIAHITQSIQEKKQRIDKVSGLISESKEKIGGIRARRNTQKDEYIPELIDRQNIARAASRKFPADLTDGSGEGKFQSELAAKKNPEKIAQDYRAQVGMRSNAVAQTESKLTNVRSIYNSTYNYSYDVTSSNNAKYNKHLFDLKQEELPKYADKIQSAKKMANEQFASQFLAEMKGNIDDVRDRINELNRALKNSAWGTDRFSFQIRENPDYKRFYDMITDPMLMDGYNLMSQLFLEKHGTAIDELFSRIADLGDAADTDARAQMEKNIKLFTDYKTYLRFDMISTDENDNRQRLSKTLLKKSGGETQTPFYIAILASFAQLYHINDKKRNCFRLIIFDEAFSKMDGERIRESIQLLKNIGFQCILSAPPEKIGDIVPLVDRNIVVIRNGHSSKTHSFDALHPALAAIMEGDDEDEN